MESMTRPHVASSRAAARGLAVLLLAFGLAAAPAAAAPGDPPLPLEVSLGFGGASASENGIFNIANDSKSSPDLMMDFRIRQSFTDALAFGFHIYGTTEETPSYPVTDTNGNVTGIVDYNLTVLHLGIDARYLFLAPPFQPYLDFGVSYVAGSVEDEVSRNLQIAGGSVGGGPGVQFLVNRHLALGVQGLFTAGTAKWEKRPFFHSTSRSYEPGFAGVEGLLTYRWRR